MTLAEEPGRKPRLLLAGAVGSNLGDEAIARALRDALQGDFEVQVTNATPGLGLPSDLPFVALDRRSAAGWRRLWRAIGEADIVVLGGGTLLQDAQGLSMASGMLAYLRQVVALTRLRRKPVVLGLVGMDPVSTPLGRRYARAVVRAARHVSVRDPASAERIVSLVPTVADRLVVGADPAFCYHPPDGAPEGPGPDEGEEAVFALVRENLDDDPLVDAFAALATHLAGAGWTVVLAAMDVRDEEEAELYRRLLDRLDPATRSQVRALDRKAGLDRTARALRSADLVVAMRLHAGILAAGFAPVVGVSRAAKTDAVFASLAIPFLPLADLTAPALVSLCSEALADGGRLLARQGQARRAQEDAAHQALDRLRGRLRELHA